MREALRRTVATRLALLISLCAGVPALSAAQSTSDQFWPELNAYYRLNSRYRLAVDASRSTDGTSYNSIELGPTLNIFARRFTRPLLTSNNQAKSNFLVFGVGYRYLAGINQATENRIQLDFTPQFPLFWGIQAGDRNRIDLRFIESSGFYWRYRNRLNAQRTFKIRRFMISPYAQGEIFYSSATESWNKTTYQFGADLPFRKHFDFEPYYEHDNNVGQSPNHVNAFGLTTSIYF
jgi:hypothetical protein